MRETAEANAHGVTFATFANAAQLDFALSWHQHLSLLGLGRSALLGATDEATNRGLSAAGARCFPLKSSIGADEAKWGSPGFSHMGRTKALLVRTLLELNATLLFADVDVVFLRDPLPYLGRQLAAHAQLLFHTDGFGSSPEAIAAQPPGLETPSFGITPEMNTGLFLMAPAAAALAAAWCAALDADGAFSNWKNDQQALNQLLRRGLVAPPAGGARKLMAAYGGSLQLGLLPNHLFPSGHLFFIQRALHRLGATPVAVHLTFQNCDQSGKRHRMREGGLWLVDDVAPHFLPAGGLLSYEPDLPPELTSRFGESKLPPRNLRLSDQLVQDHFALVNHQLAQLRSALRLALLLNRTLVLPRFVCGLETVTNFAHRGIRCLGSNGCRMALPYYCPADHVLRMHYWRGVMPQLPALQIGYREWSLLENFHSRDPEALAAHYSPDSTLRVRVRASTARPCDRCGEKGYVGGGERRRGTPLASVGGDALTPASLAATARSVELGPGEAVDEARLRRALGPHSATARLLHFESLRPGAVEPALPPQLRRAFDDTIKPLGGGWCCVAPAVRGALTHFWYDLLYDTPHVDRFGRKWTAEKPWTATPGP